MQPISSRNTNLYRGPAGSAEFNSIRNDLHHDLYALFNLANEHETLIKENMDVLIRENFFLQNKLSKLEGKLDAIKQNIIYKETGDMKQRDVQSFYSKENIIEMENDIHRADIDSHYGIATVNDSDRVSKISYKGENGKVMIPKSLVTTLYESNDSRPKDEQGMRERYIVEGTDFTGAFDQDKNTFWLRTVSFPEETSISEVTGVLHIKLPIDILTDANVNTITINPYPEYSVEITDIQYKGYGEQWHRLPNYPTKSGSDGSQIPLAISDAGKLLFSFSKREMTEVQILFRQPYWFKNNGKRDFVYGFQDINIENRVYRSQEAEFITKFSLEGTTKGFYRISEPEAIPSDTTEQNISDLVEHKLYYNSELTNEFSFGTEILAPIQTIYVKTTIKRHGDVVPVLKQLQLDYTYKDIR